MKKIFLLVILALTICCTAFANEQAIVDSFANFINPKIVEVQQSYENSKPVVTYVEGNKYVKSYYTKDIERFSYRVDVRETDSLMSPYIGVLELKRVGTSFKPHATEQEALNENQVWIDFVTRYRLVYNYNNGNWQFAKVTIFDDNMGGAPSTYDMLGQDDTSYFSMVRARQIN